MLVGTPGGGTFTFGELRDDLATAGFEKARLLRRGVAMDSVVKFAGGAGTGTISRGGFGRAREGGRASGESAGSEGGRT